MAGLTLPFTRLAGAQIKPIAPTRPQSTVSWIDSKAPERDEGQVWGQPWPRGTRFSDNGYKLVDEKGRAAALQTWPLAYWPDGSIKWTGHALAAGALLGEQAMVVPGKVRHTDNVIVRNGTSVTVECAGVIWNIPQSGPLAIASATISGREVLRDVRLLATAQMVSDDDVSARADAEALPSEVTSVFVEQMGPLRAVIRIEGHHSLAGAKVLPFSIRLYFHAGSTCVRIVHSMIFDTDPERVFLRGLGLRASVPQRDALHDRHIRFGGEEGGLWAEAVRPLTGLRRDPGEAFRAAQIAGRATPPLETMTAAVRDNLEYVPAWGDFILSQPNSDGFTITKRTKAGHGWIEVDGGRRASGFGSISGPGGGAALSLGDFWQRAPVQIDVRGAAMDTAEITAWHRAPDAPAMDLRFYHDGLGMDDYFRQNKGLDVTYEDYEPGWGTAQGVARTTEFRLWALPATPDRTTLSAMAELGAQPPRIVATPLSIQRAGLFGIWSFPENGNAAHAPLEARAKRELDFFINQVDQRRWYGFWNYGDVMHSYDNDRHVWRYDIGGFAWDNSELSTDLWLWYSYLRTGRADIFRMAEAMCRHTGEVDVYHSGRFRGLGTRHGVQHWSDSSKQPRISNAAYRRIYYYLTADERTGDLMRALLGSEERLAEVVIERKVGHVAAPGSAREAPPAGQVEMSFGTVWGSLLAAWLAEWERTRDPRWRKRIVAGMESIAALPQQWFAGSALYDLKSGRFTGQGTSVDISHLNGAFGVFEIHAELLELLDMPQYREAWLDYCEFYNAPREEFERKTGAAWKARGLRQGHSRFTAYAAVQRKRPDLAARAWAEFSGQGDRADRRAAELPRKVSGADVLRPVDEIIGISTNDAAQWGLAWLQLSALIPDTLPRP